jgi:uncharacterized membrane protein YjgN (DUF898 family)
MERRDPAAGSFFRKPPSLSAAPVAPIAPAPAPVSVPPPPLPPPTPPTPPPPPVAPSPPPVAPPPLPPPPPGGAYRTDPSATAPRRESRRVFFYGTGGALFRIQIVNAIFTLLTLGIYYFWGKAEVRRYLLSQAEIEGDRFAYHGTGKELFVGFLKAVLFFWLPFAALGMLLASLGDDGLAHSAIVVFGWLVTLVFVPYAIASARRYRLSRTSWRGIRFSFRGRPGAFIRLFAAGSVLTLLTLGLYYPFFDTRRQGFLVAHSWFGNRQFRFHATGRDLFTHFVVAVLLTLPTLGFSWFWYVARKRRTWWGSTTFETAHFRSTITGGTLLGLVLGNVLIFVLTLGLGRAWVTIRNARVACRTLHLDGWLDVAQIDQDARLTTATGEGLAGLLDVGGGLDFS